MISLGEGKEEENEERGEDAFQGVNNILLSVVVEDYMDFVRIH